MIGGPVKYIRNGRFWSMITVCIVICFIGYVLKLRQLAEESNGIFEYRCTNVNPLLIAYKNTFLRYADHVNNPDWASGPEMWSLISAYAEQMRQYIPAENAWLETEGKFMNRWDFTVFAPEYMQIAARLKFNMYKAYRDDAAYMLSIWDNPEHIDPNLKPGDTSEARTNRDAAISAYFSYFDLEKERWDWRKPFMTVKPPAACNSLNTTFPQTEGSIHWEEEVKEATPPASTEPIDPYFVT